MVDGTNGVDGAQPELVSSPPSEAGLGSFLSSLVPAGRRRYELSVEDGQLKELRRMDEPNNGYLGMPEAAKYLRHGYSWVSRHWRGLGLKPKRVGKTLFFAKTDLDAFIDRQRGPRVGRRGKMVRVVA